MHGVRWVLDLSGWSLHKLYKCLITVLLYTWNEYNIVCQTIIVKNKNVKNFLKESLGGHCDSKRWCLLNDEIIKHSIRKDLSNESSDCTHLSSHKKK